MSKAGLPGNFEFIYEIKGLGNKVISLRKKSITKGKAKKKYGMAYALYLGTGVGFAPGITAELTYSYRRMGETKKINGSDIKFEGQQLSAGVRFDL